MLKRLQSTVLSTTIVVLISQSGFAQKNGKQIYEENRTSILYLEVVRKDNPSQVTDRGTGFVISHDGYVLTAGHIQVGPNETLQAIVGQSAGLRYNLEFQQNLFDPINKAGTDLSLWRLPQAPGCDRAVLLTEQLPEPSDALWILSFSETRSLGPHVASVVSTQGPEGTILADCRAAVRGSLRGGLKEPVMPGSSETARTPYSRTPRQVKKFTGGRVLRMFCA